MVRPNGARLAVLLLTSIVITTGSFALAAPPAAAAPACVTTPTGVHCVVGGTLPGSPIEPGGGSVRRWFGKVNHPEVGWCWYLAHSPPGVDADDPRHAEFITATKAAMPECPRRSGRPISSIRATAWSVFRDLPLPTPFATLRPTVGITNLPTRLESIVPGPMSARELLPDGRILEVRAEVTLVYVDWGDSVGRTLLAAEPGDRIVAEHPYRLKTCDAGYRASHPSGHNCHAFLTAYPVEVTFVWDARYRTGQVWTALGTVDRSIIIGYDVDEVVGIPVPA